MMKKNLLFSLILFLILIININIKSETKINGSYYAIRMDKLNNPLINTKSITVDTFLSKGLQSRVDIKTIQPRDKAHGLYICEGINYEKTR